MKIILILLLVLIFSNAAAVEIKPYPKADIAIEQWQKYYDSVVSEIGHTKQDHAEAFLEVYADDKTRAGIAFTKVGHPAHPAWINRYLTEKNGAINISQIGYFAGKEEPFAQLFQQDQALTDKTREEMAKQNGWDK